MTYSRFVIQASNCHLNRVLFVSRGAVCNVLLTCCKDSVCRLWAETLLPSDCLLSGLRQNHSSSKNDSLKSSNKKKAHYNNKGQSRNLPEVSKNSAMMKRLCNIQRNWIIYEETCIEDLMYMAYLHTSNYRVEFQKHSAVGFYALSCLQPSDVLSFYCC